MKKLTLVLCTVVLSFAVGCRDAKDSHGHSHDGEAAHSHDDGHKAAPAPPHGGTPVNIADDKFHLELVLDAAGAKMHAYVMDGHLERLVEVPETSFVLVGKIGDKEESLTFQRLADAASGKVLEKSTLFEAQAEWLKTAKQFAGNIPTITLNGKTFTNISFPFPKGTIHVD